MTLRHGSFPYNSEDEDGHRPCVRWMAGHRDGDDDGEWLLHFDIGERTGGRVTWLGRSKYDFGFGFKLGRNGSESDVGLDLHAGRWAHLWLRFRAPWLKRSRVKQGADDRWYLARHTGLTIHPDRRVYLRWEIDNPSSHWKRSDPWWRSFSFGHHDLFGRTEHVSEEIDTAAPRLQLPEGFYEATATLERATWRHVRWPGTWLDRWRGVQTLTSWKLDVPSGIPVEGKGENSYDCGMDGKYGISGNFPTVADACDAMVAAVLRDRGRYGGPHNLPHPMTPGEAEAWKVAQR